ncbi:glycosyltransferase [Microbacterium trichothecenolyticum]|uniref:glycosyltransferase family protein n=1 Tax=Microbacterium trichothecenolyticum TaxID=69370 RepID=UPI0035BE55C2
MSVQSAVRTVDVRTHWRDTPRPRLVFFRLNEPDLPGFVAGHFADHVRCLEQYFEVVLVTEDADYDEVVDRVKPDLAMFESGVYARAGRSVRNTHRHPEIPKVGFLDSDAYCLTRSVFLADMEEWGVEIFFTHATSATGYSSEIADRTFSWPNFADRRIFRSYPGERSQSILLSGSRATNYPWRVAVDRLLREKFPVRSLPHTGWFSRAATEGMPSGEAYARTLSDALIIPTCGTIAGELVRKHFEIPAAGAVLVTEKTVSLEAAGFVDMENCVFADLSDVVAKVEHLLNHRDELEAIAAAGQRLAHERHSIEDRDQLRQWYELQKDCGVGEHVVQRGLFAPLTVEITGDRRSPVSPVSPAGLDRRLVDEGRRLLERGDPAGASDRFAQVLNLHFEPEAALLLSRCWLAEGRPDLARRMLEYSTDAVVRVHGAPRPDPVEWAWLIRAALCESDPTRARDLAEEYPLLRHPELDRMRWVVSVVTAAPLGFAERPPSLTLHPDAPQSWPVWRSALEDQLRALNATMLADRVHHVPPPLRELTGAPRSGLGDRAGRMVRRTVQLGKRVRARLYREWTRLRTPTAGADHLSVFQLLDGRSLDVVISLAPPAAVQVRLDDLVANDGSGVGIVRLGRTEEATAGTTFSPRGFSCGLAPGLLDRIPDWGRGFVVAGAAAACRLSVGQLGGCEVFAVVESPVDRTPVERELGQSDAWREADDEMRERIVAALANHRTRVWQRTRPDGTVPA